MLMVHISNQGRKPGRAASGSHVGQQRSVADGHHRLGKLEGEWPQTSPEASRENERARHETGL